MKKHIKQSHPPINVKVSSRVKSDTIIDRRESGYGYITHTEDMKQLSTTGSIPGYKIMTVNQTIYGIASDIIERLLRSKLYTSSRLISF